MNLCTIRTPDGDEPAIVDPARGVITVRTLLPDFDGDLMSVVADGRYEELARLAAVADDDAFAPRAEADFAVPYRRPHKIWGIGLNYREHAGDLSEKVPTEPASFIKGDHTIIGPGEPIPVPPQSERTTAEAELGLVIGRYCRNVQEAEALDYVFGVCTILDQTAEDILERNPRFLTRSKNFPGFFSFGPKVVPLSSVRRDDTDLGAVEVSTLLNGVPQRTNTVKNMAFSPAFLVSFHSAVMPLYPGDIISTGTPGAVHIRPGDSAGCHIPGVGDLTNPVVAG